MGQQTPQPKPPEQTASPFEFSTRVFRRRIEQHLKVATGPALAAGAASPGGVDLSALLSIADDTEFLREAYRRILRRECDAAGFVHYRELLRYGAPRKLILRALATSEEAKRTGLRYTGVAGLGSSLAGAGGRLRRAVFSLAWRWLGRMRWLYDALWLRPVGLVGAKVDYLLQEVQTRTEQLSVKLDATLTEQREMARQLRELEERQAALREAVLERSARPTVLFAGNNRIVTFAEGWIVAAPQQEWRAVAQLALRGPCQPGVRKRFRMLVRPGMVVVDVGAHWGWYTLEAARALGGRGRVYSFEPAPESFAVLRENLALNGLADAGVVELRQSAVTDACGTASLGICEEDSSRNSLFPDPECTGRVQVETTTLDEALARERGVDVVKIDAQGAEPLVLRGMKQIVAANPEIIVIVKLLPACLARAGTSAERLLSEIGALGFRAARIDPETGEVEQAGAAELCAAPDAVLLLRRLGEPEAMLR